MKREDERADIEVEQRLPVVADVMRENVQHLLCPCLSVIVIVICVVCPSYLSCLVACLVVCYEIAP